MAVTERFKKIFDSMYDEMGKVIIGQHEPVEQILTAILCDANALLEGYPGLAKTLMVKTLSEIMSLNFSRIQNTPDLMPSDITGTYVLQEERGQRVFKFQAGPIFANIVLADEINRATPKTQSALLEAMQEKQVTVGTSTYKLERPFFVLATQNPIEQEGTYPLPEAQADRFLLKIKTDYPTQKEEAEIIDRFTGIEKKPAMKTVMDKGTLTSLQGYARQVPISNDIKQRVVRIITATRTGKSLIDYGASPRASIGMVLASKARALMNGRNYVSNDDINKVAYPILRHRIILNFEAERKGVSTDDAIGEILNKI